MGRPKAKDSIYINFDYLYGFIKENGIKVTEIGVKMGKGESYISDCRKRDSMPEPYARLLCALYNVDFEKLTTQPKTTPTSNSTELLTTVFELTKIVNELRERVAVLEEKATKVVTVTEQEQIILLLQQMTKYGQCEESVFKAKAKSYGFSKELIGFAIENQKCKRDIANGKMWLVRRSK